MRYHKFIPALALALACHKASNPNPSAPATLSFSVNGAVYQMNGDRLQSPFGAKFVRLIGRDCVLTDTIFALQATDGVGDSLNLGTEPVSSLAVAIYLDSLTLVRTNPNGSTCSDGGGPVKLVNVSSNSFLIITPADHSTIAITNIHDGQADGTFTAHMTIYHSSPDSTITITDGQFKNVPIVNQ